MHAAAKQRLFSAVKWTMKNMFDVDARSDYGSDIWQLSRKILAVEARTGFAATQRRTEGG
jgi:hypothetical protein